MDIQAINPGFAVTGDVDANAILAFAKAGYKSVVNNRPDAEAGPEQISSQALQAAAAGAGLRYAHLPIDRNTGPTERDVAAMRVLLDSLPGPILAFCATGKRSARLHRLATTG